MIGTEVKSPEMRLQLRRHVMLVRSESRAGALIEADRQHIDDSATALAMKLEAAD